MFLVIGSGNTIIRKIESELNNLKVIQTSQNRKSDTTFIKQKERERGRTIIYTYSNNVIYTNIYIKKY